MPPVGPATLGPVLVSPDPAVVVALPGTGSDAAFARRALGPACTVRDLRFLPVQPDPSAVVASCRAALDAAAERYGPVLAAGISIGAAIAAGWACDRPGAAAGVIAALPAWTGPDTAACPAALSARVTAAQVRADGLEPTIARMRESSPAWLAETLTESWRGYGDRLPEALEEASRFAWPSERLLRAVPVPAVVIGATGDPVHPVAVAERWAELMPRATLHRVTLAEFGADPAVVGRLGLDTLVGPPLPIR